MSKQELIRHKQYCQIVKEITGSDQYMVVGIDIGKDQHHAFMGTATGKSLFRKSVTLSRKQHDHPLLHRKSCTPICPKNEIWNFRDAL